ncbi:hypothetical protein [Paenibacillus vini]|uniref:Uncharacterized protein n=1 Tax=Paenibacillus vini TaxID=1476024 RepID=A0ABQ4M9K0_9BACL|nr:hypothetical protein [Paenibacillus vini]GIP52075.1 hypothetical protein J42TS3_11100 [Paenibacillus vini]
MNERLSRSERHARNRSSANGTRKRTRRIEASETLERKASGTSYVEMAVSSETAPIISDTEYFTEGNESDVSELPTRKEMFPSQRIKITRWFYNSLLYIFIAIMIYLLWWGISDSPWGESHGL